MGAPVDSFRARPPYEAYAGIIGAFGGALALTAGLERTLRRDAPSPTPLDFVLLSAASFKAARALSRERVGSVLRQPFVESDGGEPGAAEDEHPAGSGFRRAVGELVTCTRCVGTWAAAGLLASQAVSPRFGRLLTWTLAAGAGNDFLQAAFAGARQRQPEDAVSS